MDSDGQRGNSNPAAMLTALMSRRDKFQEELRNIEKQVYELETSYLQEAEELGVGRDDGRSDYGPGRSKGGALPSNGQGKPKKGRTALTPRDGKRNRPSSEPDFDDEDDPDMNLK